MAATVVYSESGSITPGGAAVTLGTAGNDEDLGIYFLIYRMDAPWGGNPTITSAGMADRSDGAFGVEDGGDLWAIAWGNDVFPSAGNDLAITADFGCDQAYYIYFEVHVDDVGAGEYDLGGIGFTKGNGYDPTNVPFTTFISAGGGSSASPWVKNWTTHGSGDPGSVGDAYTEQFIEPFCVVGLPGTTVTEPALSDDGAYDGHNTMQVFNPTLGSLDVWYGFAADGTEDNYTNPADAVITTAFSGGEAVGVFAFGFSGDYDLGRDSEPIDLRLLKVRDTALPYMVHTRMLHDGERLARQ